MPHIDPLKEVKAERAKLGNSFVPLTTAEAATEALSAGEFDSNVVQMIKEVESSKPLEPVSAIEDLPEPPPEEE